ncbi:hypothetical protein CFC21_070041, partial [Triticum aestivum]
PRRLTPSIPCSSCSSTKSR